MNEPHLTPEKIRVASDMIDLIQTVIITWEKYYGHQPSTITLPLTMWTEFRSQLANYMCMKEPFQSCRFGRVDIYESTNSQMQVS